MTENAAEALAAFSLDVGVTLSGTDTVLREHLRSVTPGCKIPEFWTGPGMATAHLDLVAGAGFSLEFDIDREFYAVVAAGHLPPEEVTAIIFLILERLHQSHGRATLHASSYSKGGKGVLLVGDSNMGKTTLLIEAMRRGYDGIGGEHTLVDGKNILGGTKNIEMYSGHLHRYFPTMSSGSGGGWELQDSIRAPLAKFGSTCPAAPLCLVVFPILSDQSDAEVIAWSKPKALREVYHKASEVISGTKVLLDRYAYPAPSLDDGPRRAMRLEMCRSLVETVECLVIKGDPRAISDAIEAHL